MGLTDDAIPLRKLDDLGLMRQFFAGESTLLANQNLRVESAFHNELQLLAKREGVVATLKLDKPPTVLIREQTPYRDLLHQALEDNGFVQMSLSEQQGFIPYQRYKIPDGYRLNCTEARHLWRQWWISYKSNPRAQTPMQMNLLVMVREQWYPVREMVSSQGMLYIKTLVKEIVMDGSGQIAWLNKVDAVANPGSSLGSANQNSTESKLPEQRRMHPAMASRQIAQMPRRSASPNLLEQTSIPRRSEPDPAASNDAVWPGITSQPQNLPNSSKQLAPPEPQLPPQAAPEPETSQPPETVTNAAATAPVATDFSKVLQFRDGRIHVTTVIGELVIEGDNLKFWLSQEE